VRGEGGGGKGERECYHIKTNPNFVFERVKDEKDRSQKPFLSEYRSLSLAAEI
jgi:hypothetical protein